MSVTDPHHCVAPELPDADLRLYPHFLEPEWARHLYEVFLQKVPWQHDPIKVFGKTYMLFLWKSCSASMQEATQ